MNRNYSHKRHSSLLTQETQNRRPSWRYGPRPKVLAVIAAGASLLMFSATTSPAAAGTPNESAILIAALPKYTCPAGTVKVTPVSARRTVHGADVYHYSMRSGPGFDSYVTPAGFNPLTASNAVLSEMNLPARPAKATSLTAWKKAMSGYKGARQPELCEATKPFSAPGKLTRLSGGTYAESAAEGKNAFSGYVDQAQGNIFTAVGAIWNQADPNNTSTSTESTWVGIGGINSKELLQDGTTSPQSGGQAYAWFEYLGGIGVGMMDRAKVYPGDQITAEVYYSTASNGTASFYVRDGANNILNAKQTGMSVDYDSSTVDFLVERQTIPVLPLTDTGTMYFADANGQTPNGAWPVDSTGVIGIVMTTDSTFVKPPCSTSTKMLEYPNTLSGDTFEQHFCRAS
jgi:hypothetical protein